MKKVFSFFFLLSTISFAADSGQLRIGRLEYTGGDWYSNPSSLYNLITYYNQVTGQKISPRESNVSLKDQSFAKVPVIYFTGHKHFILSEEEKENLRWFLENGGFLFADDNFGLDADIRHELNSLFPGKKLTTISFSHDVFQKPFRFSKGTPKIHKHHGGPPETLGIFLEGRLAVFYAYNTDLGDGWEDMEVHHHTKEQQEAALKMGVNVLWYALHHGFTD